MKKLYCYWDEWYTIFAERPKKADVVTNSCRYIEVTDEFYDKYMAAKKEFESLTKQLMRKWYASN